MGNPGGAIDLRLQSQKIPLPLSVAQFSSKSSLQYNVERTTIAYIVWCPFIIKRDKQMKRQVNLREINQHLSQYIEAVSQGDEIIITRRGLPVARLIPIQKKRSLTMEQKAAWKRTSLRMKKGYSLGGKKFKRDDAHER